MFKLSLSGLLLFSSIFINGCQSKTETGAANLVTSSIAANLKPSVTKVTASYPDSAAESNKTALVANAATMLAKKQVPILCYHQIRNWRPRDSKRAKDYIVPEAAFKAQLKMLADSGYQTILPDQLLAYLETGAPLPPKPIMLTFDDTDLDQYTVAAPEMEKYGFKGVFFVMTVSLGRPRYMSRAQVKALSDAGHIIGSHTWDHQNVKKLSPADWAIQIDKPTKQLEAITGKPIRYFAYPFGLWKTEVIPELQKRGFRAAFQLSTKRDPENPLFTVRRLIASGYWQPKTLHRSMVNTFN
jgi:peptidoglycan/xylan/chitin deacetylase (PgdA/CDA1 family)